MNRTKYENVLKACALKKDIELFSHGDQREIGERGINWNGSKVKNRWAHLFKEPLLTIPNLKGWNEFVY